MIESVAPTACGEPSAAVKEMKLAAINLDFKTLGEFVWTCVQFYLKSRKSEALSHTKVVEP